MKNFNQIINALKWAPAGAVTAADKLVELKNTKDQWTVIEEIVKLWEATCPSEWASFVYDLEVSKQTAKVTYIGNKQFSNVSKDKGNYDHPGTGGILRHQLDIPTKVIYMIRRLYPDLPMDKEFYDKFARRFPKMVVSKVV